MKIYSNYNLSFMKNPMRTGTTKKNVPKIVLGIASMCATDLAGKDLYSFNHTSPSSEEMDNAFYNMLDLFNQLDESGYAQKQPEKYKALLSKIQIISNKYNNKILNNKDVEDFIDALLSSLLA